MSSNEEFIINLHRIYNTIINLSNDCDAIFGHNKTIWEFYQIIEKEWSDWHIVVYNEGKDIGFSVSKYVKFIYNKEYIRAIYN